ncbi:alpha/beta hydrolase [Flavobacterium hercynium]|uniref:alpha/beta hydrolase n=1 Tax=Flavobacterium hercynium TaxID=387094 RepID=UPI000B5C068B|nr:alpha/beta fold hydrolase [Flavobacterium hercynium]SMP10820.1 Serine aminopeptidase, S33 [Flavobacterium hercynium]
MLYLSAARTQSCVSILVCLFISLNQSFAQSKLDFSKEIQNTKDYNFTEIEFADTAENIILSSTLITPKKAYSKIVVITPGSGQDTRNSHYVLAENLLANGIAVYRFDDRGVGKSRGTVNFSVDQIITDLFYAIDNLQKIDSLSQKQIGLLGHSLGGIATIDNYQKGFKLDFLVLMATPIEKFGKFTKPQYQSKPNAEKVSTKTVFQNIQIPMLFVAGTNDSFFESNKTVALINNLNNKNIETKILKDLNHFLRQETDDWKKTKEYQSLYEIDSTALEIITNWIKKV